jgi:ATP/maltotriose-dependent transcriptional regulator MalT
VTLQGRAPAPSCSTGSQAQSEIGVGGRPDPIFTPTRRPLGQTPLLSEREQQILRLIADGKSVPNMAKELYLAQTTIKTHIRRLYEKLGVSDRGAAVAYAMRNQMLE